MVNTRRKDLSSPSSGTRHLRARGRVKIEVEQEDSGTSSAKDSDSEDSNAGDSSYNELEKSTKKRGSKQTAKVLEIRSKFERNFNTRSHKRISLDERRSLAVYSTRKMHDESDIDGNYSEDEIYSRSDRNRHLVGKSRLLRRTALSLRPISQKVYTDPLSPVHFNSDGEEPQVRRSKRKPKGNVSWLTDNQMHKVGYPTLNGYSEEDSRDGPNAHEKLEVTRRVTRHSRDLVHGFSSTRSRRNIKTTRYSQYFCDFDSASEQRTTEKTRRDSNDKENKTESTLNGVSNGRLRSSIKRESETKEEDNNDEDREKDEADDKEDEECAEDQSKESVVQNGIKEGTSESDEERDTRTRAMRSRSTRNDLQQRYPSRRTRSSRDPRNKKILDTTSESEEEGKKYSLRDRPPKQPAPKTMEPWRNDRSEVRRRRRFNRRYKDSSPGSSSSSSSEIARKPPKSPHSKYEKMKTGGRSKIIPINPETLDASVRFNSIGGLDSHIQCLKEMILFPMMYPDVFRQFQIQLPRGVLFHGPPGTGKTLIARALANECSFGQKKVSFFMRKGADLLSKWFGESEKQLRLLFEQAAEMKPSIIFFDELDGLAPVRTSRQDQFHSSIVSTLLALMDGLSDRGEVIVIGATNRIDAIDPALRRPGRFDRELFFPLPSRMEREEILNVHVSQWAHPPNKHLLSYLAENTVGYCGSDLRALCSEAVIQSFRRTYPQVYGSEYRLLVNPDNVKVEKVDFLRAKSFLVPASHRITQGLGRKLSPILEPLLQDSLKTVLSIIEQSFPHGLSISLAKVKLSPNLRPAQLLLTGEGSQHGQTSHLAPAILFKMEHIHAYLLDLITLLQESGRSPEEACVQIFKEARRNIPSIVYIPSIDQWWELVPQTVRVILLSQLTQVNPNVPIMFFATAETTFDQLPSEVQHIFSHYRKEVYELKRPNSEDRKMFFKSLLIDGSLARPRAPRERPKTPSPLPRAATPPPTPVSEEHAKKLYEKEEHTLRELRIFLRDMCKKLANNKLFFMFTKPVDTEEVPDYTTIIKQPMDLETMMTKVDFHRYECAKDFLTDIELICQNALEYNPARTSADKQIRHRACSLRDYAYTLIKTEMDSDFEEKCQDIKKTRRDRKACVTKYLPPYIITPEINGIIDDTKVETADMSSEAIPESSRVNSPEKSDKNSSTRGTCTKKRKVSSWQRGYIKRKKRPKMDTSHNNEEEVVNGNEEKMSSDDSKENDERLLEPSNKDNSIKDESRMSEVTTPLVINCDTQPKTTTSASLQSPRRRLSDLMSPSELLDNPLDFDEVDQALNEATGDSPSESSVECSRTELEQVLEQVVSLTEEYSLELLLDLYNQLNRIVKKYSRTPVRTNLPKELMEEILQFQKNMDPDTSC